MAAPIELLDRSVGVGRAHGRIAGLDFQVVVGGGRVCNYLVFWLMQSSVVAWLWCGAGIAVSPEPRREVVVLIYFMAKRRLWNSIVSILPNNHNYCGIVSCYSCTLDYCIWDLTTAQL